MTIDITTPSLLFPTISLLMLAHTNRHLALTSTIRQLHSQYRQNHEAHYLGQIASLRRRIKLVRNMQLLGISSLLLCTVCMLCIFIDQAHVALWVFCVSVLAMMASLVFSLLEIGQSVRAIDLHLTDLEETARGDARG